MGGGGGKSEGQTGANLMPFVKQFEGETRGLRGELFGNIESALRTGGTGAQIPLIQSAVSSSRNATSDALRSTGEGLSRSGLSGTPFGARTMAGVTQQGAQTAAGIPAQFVQQLMQLAPSAIGLAQGTLSPLGSAGTSSSKQGRGGLLTS